MDSEIARNGSGYYDPTAFEAMKNIIKKKVDKMKHGEIWEIQQNNGQFKNVIVLASHNDIAQVLHISEYGGDNSIEVNCLNDEEFEAIMDAVAEGLGLATSYEKAVEPVQEEWHPIPEVLDRLPFDGESEELIKAKTERDVYKDLYEKLLADVMKG